MIELEGISQHFRGVGGRDVHALCNVDLTIDRGEISDIIGHSGAGKNTLVHVINLLNRPISGTVTTTRQELTALNVDGLCQARRKIDMIFQHFNLLSSRIMYDSVALPPELTGTSYERTRRVMLPLLELVGLSAHKDRYLAQISGDQKQRVDIARTLTDQPDVLLSDEATSTLDPETTRSILDLLHKIDGELGLTVVLITHQIEVIEQVRDRVAVLDVGRVVELGHVIDVFLKPEHNVTRMLIGEMISRELLPSVLARVESRLTACEQGGRDRLFRLAFAGADMDQPALTQAIRDYGLDFNILHDHIDEIQDQAFNPLTILASDETAGVNNTMNFLREQGVVVEEINHVV